MAKIDRQVVLTTLKKMLSVAKILVKNESNEIFELAHYISDNVLHKICMLVGIEEEGEESILKSNGMTKDFPKLYEVLKKYYPDVPDYNNQIKDYHRIKNIYSHDYISTEFSVRRPIVERYLNMVEEILRLVGNLGNQAILPSTLILNTIDNDSRSSHEILHQKLWNFYMRLESKNLDHIIIEIKSLLDDIGSVDLGKVLKMDYIEDTKERMLLLDPHKWCLSIRSGNQGHLRLIKYIDRSSQTYDFEIPDENIEILTEYLVLIKTRYKEHGII